MSFISTILYIVLLISINLLLKNPLTYLINSSLESGTFPEEFKLAKVIPIFKNKKYQIIDQNQYYHSFLKFMKKTYITIELISLMQIKVCLNINLDFVNLIPLPM